MESRIQPGPAAGQDTLPGRDEITLSPPPRQQLCCSREHGRAGTAAGVVVSFGCLADAGHCWHSRDALWPECWGRAFPMCGECWQQALAVVTARRPGLTVRGMAGARPATRLAGPAGQAGHCRDGPAPGDRNRQLSAGRCEPGWPPARRR